MRPSRDAEYIAMVSLGSGGAFSGIRYKDEEGMTRGAGDWITDRLPYAQGLQFVQIFWAREKVAVVRAYAKSAGLSSLV